MKKRNIRAEARAAAEGILVELAESVAPVFKRLTTAQQGDVLGLVQLAWLRGHLTATAEHGKSLRESIGGLGVGVDVAKLHARLRK